MNARPTFDAAVYRAAKIERCLAAATAAFEAGFLSEAARKRAQQELSTAYEAIRETTHSEIISIAWATWPGETATEYGNRGQFFTTNDMPFGLHQVRDKHLPIFEGFTKNSAQVRDLIALRAAIKAAEIAPAPARPEIEVRAETVRRSIVEEMERRKTAFVEGLDFGRLWNEWFPRENGGVSLPVSVNAHIVHGHKGAVFSRNFFYLRGKLTQLNTIIALYETLEREQEAGR